MIIWYHNYQPNNDINIQSSASPTSGHLEGSTASRSCRHLGIITGSCASCGFTLLHPGFFYIFFLHVFLFIFGIEMYRKVLVLNGFFLRIPLTSLVIPIEIPWFPPIPRPFGSWPLWSGGKPSTCRFRLLTTSSAGLKTNIFLQCHRNRAGGGGFHGEF